MLHLKVAIEQQLSVIPHEAVAQFDILDSRPAIPFVESAMVEKDLLSNRAAPAPERGCRAPAALVHKTMHQILVLRNKIRRSGSVVVRADQSVKLRVFVERRLDATERVRIGANVRIEKEEDLAFSLTRSDIAGGGWAVPARRREQSGAELLRHLGRTVGRSVVHDDSLEARADRLSQMVQTHAQGLRGIIDRYDD